MTSLDCMGAREKLADLIADQRTQLGITQAVLAERCNVTSQQVSRWERGLATPHIRVTGTLGEVLGIDRERLLNLLAMAAQEELVEVRRDRDALARKMDQILSRVDVLLCRLEAGTAPVEPASLPPA